MFNIADFPDLKFFRLEKDKLFSVPNGGVNTSYKFESPPNRIWFLIQLNINLSITTTFIANGILIDDEPLSVNAGTANTFFRFLNQINFAKNSANSFDMGFFIPFRRRLEIIFNNTGAGAENQTIDIWAFGSEDYQKKYQGVASRAGFT